MNDYITTSINGEKCLANGQHPEHECECDECEHFLECFPEYDPKNRIYYRFNSSSKNPILIDRNTSSTPNGFILGIAGQGKKIEIKESDIIENEELKVNPEDIELFNDAVKNLDSVLCSIQEKYGDKVMLLSCEDAIILADCRNNNKKELSCIYTKGYRDIDDFQ